MDECRAAEPLKLLAGDFPQPRSLSGPRCSRSNLGLSFGYPFDSPGFFSLLRRQSKLPAILVAPRGISFPAQPLCAVSAALGVRADVPYSPLVAKTIDS